MRSGQPTQAHQELTNDLTAREAECATEEFHPLRLFQGVVGVQPLEKAPMALPKPLYGAGVRDDRLHLKPIADNARIRQQPGHIGGAEGRYAIDIEPFERDPHGGAPLQDNLPREPGLHDLQAQPFEKHALVARWEPMLGRVIVIVNWMSSREGAIGRHGQQGALSAPPRQPGGDRSKVGGFCCPVPPEPRLSLMQRQRAPHDCHWHL